MWAGIYQIGSDTFEVFRADKIEHRVITPFTPHEAAAIEIAANGRDKFEWSPSDDDLTKDSRAYWAMM